MGKPAGEWKEETLELFKQGLWDFVLEHSDMTPSGHLFVKFGVTDRKNLENRIKSRWCHDYHRTDVRAKEAELKARRHAWDAERRDKRDGWREEQRKRRARAERVKRVTKVLRWFGIGRERQKGISITGK